MSNTQKDIRKQKRQARKSLPTAEKQRKSQQVCERVISSQDFQQAQHIGAYLCMPEEVDVRAIIEAAWEADKQVYLPVVVGWGQALQFAPYTATTHLVKDMLDIDIPAVDKKCYVPAQTLDMVVTPLVAFDNLRNRIGMGGGFYDRTFAFKEENPKLGNKPVLMGVAFETQRSKETIGANPWDIRPDSIISEEIAY